jgi:hypothetical protein
VPLSRESTGKKTAQRSGPLSYLGQHSQTALLNAGTFSSAEIAMTVIVGLASMVGIIRALGMQGEVRGWSATAVVFLAALLQATAIRLSLLPSLAYR